MLVAVPVAVPVTAGVKGLVVSVAVPVAALAREEAMTIHKRYKSAPGTGVAGRELYNVSYRAATYVDLNGPSRSKSGSMIRTLLVDDHPAILWAIRRLLEQSDDVHVAGEAQDGKEALRKLDGLDVDVVLLDIFLPEMDGFAVLEALEKMPERPTVLVVSANDTAAVEEKVRAAGADGFVPKAKAYKKLLPAIREIVA